MTTPPDPEVDTPMYDQLYLELVLGGVLEPPPAATAGQQDHSDISVFVGDPDGVA